MGLPEHHQIPFSQFHTAVWNKGWSNDVQSSEQGLPTHCSVAATGLSTYQSLKDVEGLDTSSSDDESSNADSVFDAPSIASSQSSHYSSSSSTASEDTFDVVDAIPAKHTNDISTPTCDYSGRFIDPAELLSGLDSRSSVSRGKNDSQQHTAQQIPRSHPASLGPGKCNRRRSGSYDSTNGPPCRLKRDTESTDCFVMLLITFAARLITAIWPLSASPPMMSSCFNGAGVLPLEVFIHETLRRSKTSYSTLQVALFYIVLLKDKLSDRDFTKEQLKPEEGHQQPPGPSTCRAMQCGRRMFLAALMLASKYLQDRNYSTRAWSKISGLRIPEINENETEYLRSIDYALHMKKEAFENWSKIVLTLSRLSKVRPGCAPNSLPILNHGSRDTPASSSWDIDGPQQYSSQWWNDLLRKLEPKLVDDSNGTDAFLAEHLRVDNVAEFLAHHAGGLPTPPTSPPSGPAQGFDMTLSEALTPRNGSAQALPTPAEMRAPAPSPGRLTALPVRPLLRNLPTPQSTPRGVDASPALPVLRQPQQSLRCSASLDVLRAMRKQCILNANLERCPPPRPQSLAMPAGRSLMRPAESNLACYSRSATPAVFSPTASTTSEATPTSRSRSSSISSNSSWSSWAAGPPPSFQSQLQSQTSSPLRRVTSLPEQPPSQSTKPEHCLRRMPNFASALSSVAENRLSSAFLGFCDEGYGSGEDPTAKLTMKTSESRDAEIEVAEALMDMRAAITSTPRGAYTRRSSAESTPTPRGHKRTISKTNDAVLQDRVSELLRGQTSEDEVMEDCTSTPQPSHMDKQWQKPNKKWAVTKRPVPNSMDSKRMALYCAMQSPSASIVAARYLKEQLISA